MAEVVEVKKDDVKELIMLKAYCCRGACIGPVVQDFLITTEMREENLKYFKDILNFKDELEDCVFYRIFGRGDIKKGKHPNNYGSWINY